MRPPFTAATNATTSTRNAGPATFLLSRSRSKLFDSSMQALFPLAPLRLLRRQLVDIIHHLFHIFEHLHDKLFRIMPAKSVSTYHFSRISITLNGFIICYCACGPIAIYLNH